MEGTNTYLISYFTLKALFLFVFVFIHILPSEFSEVIVMHVLAN